MDKIEQSIKYLNKYIDHLCLKHDFHVRVLNASTKVIGDHKILMDRGGFNGGWNKPDKTLHNIEIRYMWKNIPFGY